MSALHQLIFLFVVIEIFTELLRDFSLIYWLMFWCLLCRL